MGTGDIFSVMQKGQRSISVACTKPIVQSESLIWDPIDFVLLLVLLENYTVASFL